VVVVVVVVERAEQRVGTQSAVGPSMFVWLVRQAEPNGRSRQLSIQTRQQNQRVRD